jgi:hypothetical protein
MHTNAQHALKGPVTQLLGMALDWRPNPTSKPLAVALAYWSNLAQSGLPKRSDLSPREMLPFLTLVQIYQLAPDAATFTIRLMGTGVRPLFDRDMTGQTIERPAPDASDNAALLNRRMFAIFDAMRSEPEPVLASVPRTVIDKLHGQPLATLFLPLSSDGLGVDMVLAVTDVPNATSVN